MPSHRRLPLLSFLLIVALASGCGLFGGEDEEPPAEVVIEDLEVGTAPPPRRARR